MPIFTRRRLQAMLSDLQPQLKGSKGVDLLRRLENKRVDQALPAEMELALLWGLSQLGEVEIEPEWFGTGSVPDAYSECLFSGHETIIEIAAASDASLSQEDDMRGIAQKICDAANQIKRNAGKHLHFEFTEASGYHDGTYFRYRNIDPKFAISATTKTKLRAWLSSASLIDGAKIRLIEGKTEVIATWHRHLQSRHANFFSSMPAMAHSISDNPLYSVLRAKSSQLRNIESGSLRCLLLADSGSELLRNLEHQDPLKRTVSGRQIIEHFLAQSSCTLDVVCVVAPFRQSSFNFGLPLPLSWKISVFVKPGRTLSTEGLERLAATLPRPRFEGYQANSLHRQSSFTPTSRGWYVGTHIKMEAFNVEISISSRALLDLLAGRLSQENFMDCIGMTEESNQKNLFKLCLERGQIISDVKIERGGIDEDDAPRVTIVVASLEPRTWGRR